MASKIIAGVAVVLRAAKAIDKANRELLPRLADTLKGMEQLTSAQFDAAHGEAVKAAFIKGGSSPDVAKVQASQYKVAALALLAGIKPEKGESLRPFIARTRDELKARGIYAPKTGGRPAGTTGGKVEAGKPADTKKGKAAGKSARQQAAELLAGKDAALILWAVADKDAMNILREMMTATRKAA